MSSEVQASMSDNLRGVGNIITVQNITLDFPLDFPYYYLRCIQPTIRLCSSAILSLAIQGPIARERLYYLQHTSSPAVGCWARSMEPARLFVCTRCKHYHWVLEGDEGQRGRDK